jgi:hypothetical protein
MLDVKRREFITLVGGRGGCVAARGLAARTQPVELRTFLGAMTPSKPADYRLCQQQIGIRFSRETPTKITIWWCRHPRRTSKARPVGGDATIEVRSDLPDPCQPTASLCPKAEDGNRRKSVLQRARQRSGWIISTLRRKSPR